MQTIKQLSPTGPSIEKVLEMVGKTGVFPDSVIQDFLKRDREREVEYRQQTEESRQRMAEIEAEGRVRKARFEKQMAELEARRQ